MLRRSLLWALAVALPLACAANEANEAEDDADAKQAGSGGGNPCAGPDAPSKPECGGPTSSSEASSGTGAGEPVCPHEGPAVIDPSTLPPCESCGGGHCVPTSLVPGEVLSDLASCDESTVCVPDHMIETGGNFILDECESIGGMEGRCISTCLPEIAAQADKLPQSSCPDEHVCAPCYDPFDGTDTQACTLSCDPGPHGPPEELPSCCSSIGHCVPGELVPSEQQSNLDADSCSGGGEKCLPDVYLDLPYAPLPCETGWTSSIFGDSYLAGACVPGCLPAVTGLFQDLLLDQDGCPGGFLCAPCLTPPSGDPSGACQVIGGSCAGACGDQSPHGCWCDTECVQYGDCCGDACALCGSC